MKTKIKSILAILIFCVMAISYTNSSAQGTIRIRPTDENALVSDLDLSAKIISARLRDFSPDKFDLIVDKEKKEITVKLLGKQNQALVEELLTQKGKLAFYETWNRKELTELLKGDKQLFTLLTSKNTNDTDAEMGCVAVKEMEKVKSYLEALNLKKKCLFAWTRSFEKESNCLYALKTELNPDGVIKGSDIDSVVYSLSKFNSMPEVLITMKKGAVGVWGELTKKNMERSIAIVLDGEVLSAPKVMSEIKGGRSSITGNFTRDEAKFIAAMGNNGILPLSFVIVK
ncbi:MAG: hypothetical protein V2A54_08160 [Bacteroidota bacterium]